MLQTDLRISPRMSLGTRLAVDLMPLGPSALLARAALVAVENPALRIVAPEGGQGLHPLFDPDAMAAAGGSLIAHVLGQIEMLGLTPRARVLALALAESLEPTGWLGAGIPALARACGVPAQEMESVLHRLQQLEPAGLFARSLAECLRLQAIDSGELTQAMAAVLDRLPLIAAGDAEAVAQDAGLPRAEIESAIRKLRAYNPKPGLAFAAPMPALSPPDLLARRMASGWNVERHPAFPRFEMRRGAGDPASARLWCQAIERRADLGLMISRLVVQRQLAFLEGQGDLLSLTSQDLGKAANVHVATVNRVLKGTVMATPSITGPLRLWMARPVRAEGGATIAAAKRSLARLLSDPATGGLSDAALSRALADQGIRIARRTVAKYRQSLKGDGD